MISRFALCVCALLAAGFSVAAAATPGAAPTAHDPQFANLALWPEPDGKPLYKTQKWPPARVLMWAKPGVSAGGAARGLNRGKGATADLKDPANWLVNGQPPAALPAAGEVVDVVFPEAAASYSVVPQGMNIRHITVERNAATSVGTLKGNLWIKAGGQFRNGGTGRGGFKIAGGEHTFLRNDNPESSALTSIGQWVLVNKTQGFSVEFVGINSSGDEMKVNEGTAIIGPGGKFLAGMMSIQIIGPEAGLQLQSGAFFSKRGNFTRNTPDMQVQGKLTGGAPARPLIKDATMGLSYKYMSKEVLQSDGSAQFHDDSYRANGKTVGFVVEPKGQMRVFSKDPKTARLIVTWHGFEARGQSEAAEPHSINMALLGDVDLNGVLLDCVKKGGVFLANAKARSKWTGLSFGARNEGKPDELFAAVTAAGPGNAKPGPGTKPVGE